MNENYVIIGCDENPYYYDFWPIISKIWKIKFNYTPVLGLICDEDSDFYEDDYGIIKKFKKIENIDIGLQTQIVRLYLPKLLTGNCLISDIDMMPLSVDYFSNNLKLLTNNNIILYSSDNPECLQENIFPMCYILGTTEVYKQIFDLELSWQDFTELLNSRNEKWFTDQKYLYEKINNQKNIEVVHLKRGWDGPANYRIDRVYWMYDKDKVKEGYYIDSHLLRPFKEYEHEINALSNLILT